MRFMLIVSVTVDKTLLVLGFGLGLGSTNVQSPASVSIVLPVIRVNSEHSHAALLALMWEGLFVVFIYFSLTLNNGGLAVPFSF